MMPKTYDVIVTRDTTESVQLQVEATDRAEATEKALALSRDQNALWEVGASWESDDTPNASKDHYVTGCDEVEIDEGSGS